MKEQVVVANPYNDEHIRLIEEYESRNDLKNSTSEYLQKTRYMMSEIDYKQLEQERPEILKTLLLLRGDKIITVAHLVGEKDRKVCQMTIDNTTSPKWQEKMLEEAENYAFTTLGMEEVVLFQDGTQIPTTYFSNHEFDNLGVEYGMQVYMKSRNIEKNTTYQI
ncbi:MAG: hypothetical protein PUE33_04575 [bacterium]|nr:hypothetical protein [bacterium]